MSFTSKISKGRIYLKAWELRLWDSGQSPSISVVTAWKMEVPRRFNQNNIYWKLKSVKTQSFDDLSSNSKFYKRYRGKLEFLTLLLTRATGARLRIFSWWSLWRKVIDHRMPQYNVRHSIPHRQPQDKGYAPKRLHTVSRTGLGQGRSPCYT